MSYLQFLNYLLSLGPRLPSLLASIERIVSVVMEEVANIRAILGVAETFQSVPPSESEAAAEAKVIEAAMGGAETFGGPFSRILDFIRAHPELIALLLKFLK